MTMPGKTSITHFKYLAETERYLKWVILVSQHIVLCEYRMPRFIGYKIVWVKRFPSPFTASHISALHMHPQRPPTRSCPLIPPRVWLS